MDRSLTFQPVRLVVDEITCERGSRLILTDIGFSLGPAQLLSLTGPNGSGKSSLLRLIAGLLRPTSGEIRFEWIQAQDTKVDQTEHAEDLLHYFGHADALKPSMTLRDNLEFWRALYGGDDQDLSETAVGVGLDHALDLPARVLSAGQGRRAGLARLLLSPRPIWLLDEPTSALDSEGERLLGELMQNHLRAGGLIVAATHAPLPIKPDLALALGAGA